MKSSRLKHSLKQTPTMNHRTKHIRWILPLLCLSLLLSACLTETDDVTDSSAQTEGNLHTEYAVRYEEPVLLENIMPEMISNLSYGGFVSKEYAVDVSEDPHYDIVSLMGRWCVEGSTTDTIALATETMIDALFKPDTSGTVVTEMSAFPNTIVFGLNSNGYASSTLMDMYVYAWEYLLADFSLLNQEGNSFTAMIPFSVYGDTLAVGFYDASGRDDAVLVQELDYLMDWKGWKLTLTYGDESVTYVPRSILEDSENGIVTNGGGIVSGYVGIDGITEVYPGDKKVVIDGEERKASFDFREDGTVTIKVRRGNTYDLAFRYSGETLTLIDGDHVALYGTMSSE